MKSSLLIITMFVSTMSFGQIFKKDWSGFNATNWSIIFNSDTTAYLGKQPKGKLIFKNRLKEAPSITYFVYFKSEIDSEFEKKIQNWLFNQSCANITNGQSNFISFDLGRYYYLLEPCHSCNTGINKHCEKLSKNIMEFNLKSK